MVNQCSAPAILCINYENFNEKYKKNLPPISMLKVSDTPGLWPTRLQKFTTLNTGEGDNFWNYIKNNFSQDILHTIVWKIVKHWFFSLSILLIYLIVII